MIKYGKHEYRVGRTYPSYPSIPMSTYPWCISIYPTALYLTRKRFYALLPPS
jgi:hypothetical protein